MRGQPVLAFGLACYVLSVAGLVGLALAGTEGRFVYIFDDAYIHMAIARSWAEHGVWGLTRYGFTSSTSSPLWTFLIGLVFRLIGTHDLVPLALSVAAGAGAVVAAHDWVRAWAWRPGWQALFLAALTLAGPLPVLALSGMEHTLHVMLVLVFVRRVARWVANNEPPGWVWPWLVWASALTLVRLESAFVIAVSSLVLVAARRRWRLAGALLVAGALPVVLYGLWSQANGWWFLPNSIVVKAGLPDAANLLALLGPLNPFNLIANLFLCPPLLGVLAAGTGYLLLARRLGWVWEGDNAAVVVLVGSLLAHAQFASVLWFCRYEAYLLVWGGLALAAVGGRALSSSLAAVGTVRVYALLTTMLLVGVLGLYAWRAVSVNPLGPQASVNIFQQQVQMARFVAQATGPGETVVLNDIGAVAFSNPDVRVLDIVGLATMETAALKRAGTLTPDGVAALAASQGARFAILYPPEAYELYQPRQWPELARWAIPNNLVAGHPEVVIYLIDPAAEADLRAALDAFEPTLPPDVIVK